MLGGDPLRRPEPLIQSVYSYVAYRVGDRPMQRTSRTTRSNAHCASAIPTTGRRAPRRRGCFGVARTCVAEHFGQRDPGGASAPDPGTGHDLEGDAVQRVTIQSAIARLGDRDRELITLRYGADLKVREIAELLGGTDEYDRGRAPPGARTAPPGSRHADRLGRAAHSAAVRKQRRQKYLG